VRAPDAIYIDTTHAAVDDVVRQVLQLVDARATAEHAPG
jgi:cytidylate kinase